MKNPNPQTETPSTESSALRADENIGIPKISFGTPDKKWEQYGLLTAPIDFDAKPSGFNGLLKDGQLVTIVGSYYKVLPNEEAAKIADQAAKMAGLVPFDEFTGDWFNRMDDHVITDKGGRRMHALYAFNKPYQVNGQKMHIGVGIHNSIDGTTAFGAGIFTFRHACSNMVLAGTKRYSQAFDQRKTIEYLYKRHTLTLDPVIGQLKTVILGVMDRAKEIIQTYIEMDQARLTVELANRLKRSKLPTKILPDYIPKEEEKIKTVPNTTQWQVYNDITEAIWHNAKTELRTKEHHFDVLHQTIQVVKA